MDLRRAPVFLSALLMTAFAGIALSARSATPATCESLVNLTTSAESDDRYTQTSEGAMGREGKKRGWFRGTPTLVRNPALCGRSGLRVQQAAMVS